MVNWKFWSKPRKRLSSMRGVWAEGKSNRSDFQDFVQSHKLPFDFGIGDAELDQAMRTDALGHRFTRRRALDVLDQWFELEPRSVESLVQPYLEDMHARLAFIDSWTYALDAGRGYIHKIYDEQILDVNSNNRLDQLKWEVTQGIPVELQAYSYHSCKPQYQASPFPQGPREPYLTYNIRGVPIHPSRIIPLYWWKPDSPAVRAHEGVSILSPIWSDLVRLNRVVEGYTHNAIRWGPGFLIISMEANDRQDLIDAADQFEEMTSKGQLWIGKDWMDARFEGSQGKQIPLKDITDPMHARICAGQKMPQAVLVGSPRGNVEGSELDEYSNQSSLADDLLPLEAYLAELINGILVALGRKRLRYGFKWKFLEDALPRMKTELFYKRAVSLNYLTNKNAFTINEIREFGNKLFSDYGMNFQPVAGGNVIPYEKELFTASDEVEVKKKQAENPMWKTPAMQAAEERHDAPIQELIETKTAKELGVTRLTKQRWKEKVANHTGHG